MAPYTLGPSLLAQVPGTYIRTHKHCRSALSFQRLFIMYTGFYVAL